MSANEATVTNLGEHHMKIEMLEAAPATVSAWGKRQVALALTLGALLSAAVAAHAGLGWYQTATQLYSPGPAGALYSVQLVNGQIYYGVLAEARSAFVRLDNVYYIQSYQQPNGQPGNRVVNRGKNDWHSPASQTIPSDKILFMEAVGPQSQVARLIQQDKAGTPP